MRYRLISPICSLGVSFESLWEMKDCLLQMLKAMEKVVIKDSDDHVKLERAGWAIWKSSDLTVEYINHVCTGFITVVREEE